MLPQRKRRQLRLPKTLLNCSNHSGMRSQFNAEFSIRTYPCRQIVSKREEEALIRLPLA
jgi:hypothetical protein